MGRLAPEQMEFFRTEGYLVVNDVFAPGELTPLREELAGVIDGKIKQLLADGSLAPEHSFPEADFDHRLPLIAERDLTSAMKIIGHLEGNMGSGYTGKALFETIVHPKLIAVIEDLIGPEIIGSSAYYIRPKMPNSKRGEVPWHQDSAYFLAHCDQSMIITCWLPLVNATIANGCLTVLPRAHKAAELMLHHAFPGGGGGLVIKEADLAGEARPVPVPVPLGGALFFTNRTPHCSTPNTSDIMRWSFDLRYQSADAPNNVGQTPEQYRNDTDEYRIACWPPEADFVIRSRKHPEQAVDTYEKFKALRQSFQTRFPLDSSHFRRKWPVV